jgi:hypothetical protein
MKPRTLTITLSAFVMLLGATACSDSTSPGGSGGQAGSDSFDASVTQDLAPSAGEDIATDYSFMSAADMSGGGGSFSIGTQEATVVGDGVSAAVAPPRGGASAWISPLCVFDAATGRFNCPPLKLLKQAFTVSYALFDANGTTQSAYDKRTTASINFIVADTGEVSFSWNGNSFSDTTYRLHNRTVSTLLSDTVHTWNGNGNGYINSSRTGQITKTYSFTSIDTVSAVLFRQPRGINPYPLGGTLIRDYTVVRSRQASDTTTHSATRRVIVTFNGTVDVPMMINDVAYSLNLDTHTVTKQ